MHLITRLKKKIVGIRPGEKLHETMFNKEESSNVIEFKNYYLVKPSIAFYKQRNYLINSYNEKGKILKKTFEYNSGTNSKFLNVSTRLSLHLVRMISNRSKISSS